MGSLPSGSCEGGVHWAQAGTKQSCAVCRQGGRQIVKTLKLSKYEEEHHGDGKSLVNYEHDSRATQHGEAVQYCSWDEHCNKVYIGVPYPCVGTVNLALLQYQEQ